MNQNLKIAIFSLVLGACGRSSEVVVDATPPEVSPGQGEIKPINQGTVELGHACQRQSDCIGFAIPQLTEENIAGSSFTACLRNQETQATACRIAFFAKFDDLDKTYIPANRAKGEEYGYLFYIPNGCAPDGAYTTAMSLPKDLDVGSRFAPGKSFPIHCGNNYATDSYYAMPY
jgi:hypothetical protein